MITRTCLAGGEVGTLLDTGAGVNTVPEELAAVRAINEAQKRQIKPQNFEYLVIRALRRKQD